MSEAATITCRVLLFAQLAESIGERTISVTIPASSTVADALSALANEHEAIAQMQGRIAFAIGDRYVRSDYELHDGDVLALIPPVSGG